MPTGERVLVIGATQGTGEHIVRLLLRDGYGVRVLARNEGKARARFGDRVEVVVGDVTKPDTLSAAFPAVDHVILTVGVTQRPASEALVKPTVYDGTLHVLAAATDAGLGGRFMYMSALGTTRWSLLAFLLNLIKGNTLHWRQRVEEEIRRSGVDHTIVHAGILTDAPAGRKAIRIGQDELPMSWRYRISREDVAEVFVQALRHPRTRNTTFDAVWGQGEPPGDWDALFARLAPDGP
jgi:uncharacterized protein YbjT (DUF2867 family)